MNQVTQSLLVVFLLLHASCSVKNTSPNFSVENLSPAQFVFTKEIHNFGDAVAGEQLLGSFRFHNVGESEGKISKIISSCGCLNFEYPEDGISGNDEERIRVIFNTQGEWGNQIKSFDVVTNYGDTLTLTITARVENEQFKNFY